MSATASSTMALQAEIGMLARQESRNLRQILLLRAELDRYKQREIKLWNALCVAPPLVRRDDLKRWLKATATAEASAVAAPSLGRASDQRWEAMPL